MTLDDSGGDGSTYWIPPRFLGIFGLVFFGLATIVSIARAVRGVFAAEPVRAGRRSSAEIAADLNASAAPPIATAQLEPRNRRVPDPRSWNWTNAAARLAMAWVAPVLVQVANSLLDEPMASENFMVLLWMFVLIMGIFFASDAWHGKLQQKTVGLDPNHAVLMGIACWPIKRTRALRIDSLARVRFRRIVYGRWLQGFFVLREVGGAEVMVEDEPWVRALVLDALAKGEVRVSHLASRELAGMFTWWSYPLAFVRFMLYLLVGGGAGTFIAEVFGLSL